MLIDSEQITQKRYARQISLRDFGQAGQKILERSKVLIIGAGALGNPVALYLAASGIGSIGICDDDIVDISNLQRQIIFNENDLSKKKSELVANKINRINKNIDVKIFDTRLNDENCYNIIQFWDIIIDCSDNFVTRHILNKATFLHKKIYISGAIAGYKGQVSTHKAFLLGNHPCFACFCPETIETEFCIDCNSEGVLGSLGGIVGSIQATEAIKELLDIGTGLSGSIIFYDAYTQNWRKTKLNRNPNCNICGDNLKNTAII